MYVHVTYSFYLIFLLSFLAYTSSKDVISKFSKITKLYCCIGDNVTISQNVSCEMKYLNSSASSLEIDVYFTRPVDNILLNVQLFRKFAQNYRGFSINVTISVCEFYRGKDQSYFLDSLLKWMKAGSNFNHSCPFEGQLMARSLIAPPLPAYIPYGDYRIDLRFYEKSLAHYLGTIGAYIKAGP